MAVEGYVFLGPSVGTTAGSVAAGDHNHARTLVSGQWRTTLGGAISTNSHAASTERAQPVTLPPGTVLQTVAVNVTTLAASSTVRLGIRADAAGRPGTLLADWGTVASDTTGIKTLAAAFTVPAGSSRLWLTATAQGGAPTLAARAVAGSDIDGLTTAEVYTQTIAAVFQTGVTGALPGTFTAAGVIGLSTLIAVQAA